ncbi:MAG: carboxypeptidase-like regulatory domain-containing protein [Terracidiphilus sp.]
MDVVVPRFGSAVLLISAVLLFPILHLPAQSGRPFPAAAGPEALPDAPQPLPVPTSTESFGDQLLASQIWVYAGVAGIQKGLEQSPQQPFPALDPSAASISGTVTDVNGTVIEGAAIVLEGTEPGDRQTAAANERGAFEFHNLKSGIQYRVSIAAKGMAPWKSPPIVLTPGQFFFLTDIKLKLPASSVSVTVYASQEQIATQQVIVAEKQRVFGIIPNFYVTYDSHPVPLTTKLKYRLAFKSATDPMTFVGVAFIAAIYQAGDIPDYQQGWKGYGQRFGAGLADTTTDIFFGGAILPSLLHQDPRYFYQGTGTTKSRALHALSSPYICMGDNGKLQPNYSSMGGDLISGAISNIYYPDTNRGSRLVFQGFLITTGVRTVNALIQEFVLRNLTPSARQKK